MTDGEIARILFARLDAAHARIKKLAEHKAIPEWVSRSIKETTAEAEKTIGTLREYVSARMPHE